MFENEIKDFCIEKPLYSSYVINNKNYQFLESLFFTAVTIDMYCTECKKEAPFKSNRLGKQIHNKRNRSYLEFEDFEEKREHEGLISTLEMYDKLLEKFWKDVHPIHLNFTCQRNPDHIVYYFFQFKDNKLFKIGQYPSTATIDQAELHKYRSILGEKTYKEFNTGVGLASHGVGIGSFVYLRRVFEKLIEDEHQNAQSEVDWDEDIYKQSDMSGKIKILSDYLPQFLVKHRTLYGILSKGIHELNEVICLEMFQSVKTAIEIILDEKIEQKQRENKIQKASKFIQDTYAKLK